MSKQMPVPEECVLLSLYDIKAGTHSELMCGTVESLEMFFSHIVNTHTESVHHLFPSDFLIYKHGNFVDGRIIPCDEIEIFGTLGGYRRACKYCNDDNNPNLTDGVNLND